MEVLSPVMVTVWSPVVRVVGAYDQLPVVPAVTEVAAPSMSIETDEDAAAVPPRMGFSVVYHHSVPGVPAVVLELPIVSKVKAMAWRVKKSNPRKMVKRARIFLGMGL